MAKITRVQFSRNYPVDDPRRVTQEELEFPKSGVFIFFGLIVRADISWPNNKDMAKYAKTKIEKLKTVGIFDDSDLRSLDARLWDSTFVQCIIEIDDLKYAKELFNKAISAPNGIVDIYLYDGLELVDKFD